MESNLMEDLPVNLLIRKTTVKPIDTDYVIIF